MAVSLRGKIMRLYISQYCRAIFYITMFFSLVSWSGTPSFAAATQEAVEASQFFSSLQDIPLMPGMEELDDYAVSFDKPGGRITESVALIHDLAEADVLRFYYVTLPQLGWGRVSEYRFFRQNEFLDFSFESIEGQRAIRIMIGPTL